MANVFKQVLFMVDAACIEINPDDPLINDLPCAATIRQLLKNRGVRARYNVNPLSLHHDAVVTGTNKIYTNVYDAPVDFITRELAFAKWLKEELLDIGNKLTQRYNDESYYEKERIMHLVRNMICGDRWFEHGRNKPARPYTFKRYIAIMWQIEMGYRLLYRRDAILIKPDSNSDVAYPAWQDIRMFEDGDAFPVYFTGVAELDTPIATWSHDRVYNAMKMLCRVRVMPMLISTAKDIEKVHQKENTLPIYIKGIAYQTQRQLTLFNAYVAALVDRLAMLCFIPVTVYADKFNPEFPLWFTKRVHDSEVDEIREKMGIGGGRIDILKRVRKHRETEDAKIRKSTGYDATSLKKVSRQERIEAVIKALDREMRSTRGMERDLNAHRLTLIELEKSATCDYICEEDAEFDAAEALRVKECIRNLEISIAAKKEEDAKEELRKAEELTSDVMALLKLNDDQIEQEMREREEEAAKLMQQEEEKKKNAMAQIQLIPSEQWYLMNMNIADSILSWTVYVGVGVAPPNISHFKSEVVSACIDYMRKVEDSSIDRVMKWTIEHGLSLWERENYRMDLEGETHIDLYNVWKSVYRIDIAPDPGDNTEYEVPKDLPDFPTSFDALISEGNKYYMIGRGYVGWYYLYQTFGTLEIDRWFFYWEFEKEAGCMDHPDIKSPVMSKIGCEWVIIEPFKWATSEPKICRCGYDFFDCLAYYLVILNEYEWMVHRRGSTNDMMDFTSTDIHILYEKAQAKHTLLLQASETNPS
jgi:hypothetical protein